MEDVIIKFGGSEGFGLMQGAGYTGSNPNVAAAFNHMFAPELAVAGMSTQVSGSNQNHSHNDVAVQALAAVSGLKGISGGRA